MSICPASVRKAAFDPTGSWGLRLSLPALCYFGRLSGSSRLRQQWHKPHCSVIQTQSANCRLRNERRIAIPPSRPESEICIEFLIYALRQILVYLEMRLIYAWSWNCCVKERNHEIHRAHSRPSLPWANGAGGQRDSGSTLPYARPRECRVSMVNPSG